MHEAYGGPLVRTVLAAALALFGVAVVPHPGRAAEEPSAEELMRGVDERDEGNDLEWDIEMTLVDRNGARRQRAARLLRKRYAPSGRRQDKQVTVFLAPANVRQVGLLSFDNKGEAKDDDIWLYLPALKKLRRIPASERGDNFVGTDLTYEDIKGGFAYRDYDYRLLGKRTWSDGGETRAAYAVEARPKTPKLQDALGFARAEILVLDELRMRVQQRFFDAQDKLERSFDVHDIRKIDGIWAWTRLKAENLETGHRTEMVIRQAKYNQGLPDDLFHERTLLLEKVR
jgi:uncharacterized protein